MHQSIRLLSSTTSISSRKRITLYSWAAILAISLYFTCTRLSIISLCNLSSSPIGRPVVSHANRFTKNRSVSISTKYFNFLKSLSNNWRVNWNPFLTSYILSIHSNDEFESSQIISNVCAKKKKRKRKQVEDTKWLVLTANRKQCNSVSGQWTFIASCPLRVSLEWERGGYSRNTVRSIQRRGYVAPLL